MKSSQTLLLAVSALNFANEDSPGQRYLHPTSLTFFTSKLPLHWCPLKMFRLACDNWLNFCLNQLCISAFSSDKTFLLLTQRRHWQAKIWAVWQQASRITVRKYSDCAFLGSCQPVPHFLFGDKSALNCAIAFKNVHLWMISQQNLKFGMDRVLVQKIDAFYLLK